MTIEPIAQVVKCPIPGFTEVEVTYNVMASNKQFDALGRGLDKETAEGVILEIKGWPLNGTDPYGEDAPSLWRRWLGRNGAAVAIITKLNDPDFTTA